MGHTEDSEMNEPREVSRYPVDPEYARKKEEWYDANGWISVEDRWPPRHQDVWCYNRDGWQFEGRICAGMHKPFFTYPRGDGNPSNTAPNWIDVTHWRPLSPPPRKD